LTTDTVPDHGVPARSSKLRLPLLDQYLREQQDLTAVERFARHHDESTSGGRYRELMPASPPGPGQQYAFEVDLDACSGCKACVTACHNLNGLDEGETWRSVGLLQGGSAEAPVQYIVTAACHHCLEPACMTGCPVGAYDKDPITGIVRHLDDQCIGCQYCTFTCPYEVPHYNAKRGIVRKCDMCNGRLAAGEAPACVQACPSGAIAIAVVETLQVIEQAGDGVVLPGGPSPRITLPATVYRTERSQPRNLLPAKLPRIAPSHHASLVVMQVLTQLSAGAFAVAAIGGWFLSARAVAALQPVHAIAATSVGLAGLAAGVFHLGRPRYAFRAVIGIRTSWLSREMVAFGLFALAAVAFAAASYLGLSPRAAIALGWTVAALGVAAVGCSVFVFHATRRSGWRASITGGEFVMTAAVLGLATTVATMSAVDPAVVPSALLRLVVAASAIKIACEAAVVRRLRDRGRAAFQPGERLVTGELRARSMVRFLAIALGGVAMPVVDAEVHQFGLAVVGLVVLVIGELLERSRFFAAANAAGTHGGPG
jgi:Fe-S-cluster-containing dehydrogenase component/DMSO reductase anchor subunit